MTGKDLPAFAIGDAKEVRVADRLFDAIETEILWSRLATIMDEVDAATIRTAFSTVLTEGRDFACILLDDQGRSLAQGTLSTTGFTVSLPRTAKALLEANGQDEFGAGDTLATNDPWLGSGHLPDHSFLTPIFYNARRVGFIGTVAHLTDVGGRLGYFNGVDVYEEGLRLPPTMLFKHGEPNPVVMGIVAANVRAPDLVVGDMRAIVGAHRVGVEKVASLLEEYGLGDLHGIAEVILGRSAESMRQQIRQIPDGLYRADLDCDGYRTPKRIVVAVEVRGDEIFADFEGTSEQTREAAINAPFNVTVADTIFALKCALVPDVRNNEGLFWPIHVSAPSGCILNTEFPHAVQARSKVSMHVHQVIFKALSRALRGSVQAGSGASWPIALSGRREDGSRFGVHFFCHGGKGATFSADGLATTAFPYNAAAGSVELYEQEAPVIFECKELIADSGGGGRFRGGLAQRVVVRGKGAMPMTAWVRPDKIKYPSIGLDGGMDGSGGVFRVRGSEEPAPTTYELRDGDSVELLLPGGGGFGDPLERSVEAVVEDVAEGYVSREAARDIYGVVFAAGAVDMEASVLERAHRTERPGQKVGVTQ